MSSLNRFDYTEQDQDPQRFNQTQLVPGQIPHYRPRQDSKGIQAQRKTMNLIQKQMQASQNQNLSFDKIKQASPSALNSHDSSFGLQPVVGKRAAASSSLFSSQRGW